MEHTLMKIWLDVNFPFVGCTVDACMALNDFKKGDYASGSINAISAIFGFYTLGIWNAAKTVATKAAEDAAKSAIKSSMKGLSREATKKAGKQFGKDLAKGAIKLVLETTAEEASKKTFQSVGNAFAMYARSSPGKTAGHKFADAAFQLTGEVFFENVMKAGGTKAAKNAFTHTFVERAAKEASIHIMKNANTTCNELNEMKSYLTYVLNESDSE